jgi:hypothetical protein
MAHLNHERVRVLYLNTQNRLILDQIVSDGTLDESAIYTREIIAKAMAIGAAALILGPQSVNPVYIYLQQTPEMQRHALDEAAKDARLRAQITASAAGATSAASSIPLRRRVLICWLLSSSAVTSAHMPTVCALGVEMGMALACAPGVTAHATSCPMAEASSTSRAIASVLACTCAKMCTASPRAADKSARAIGGASSDLTPISNKARAARRRARRSAGTWARRHAGTHHPGTESFNMYLGTRARAIRERRAATCLCTL